MALDIAILGTTGSPELSVSIGVAAHVHLMAVASASKLPLVSRIRDYYGDAEFAEHEVPTLVAEVNSILESCSPDLELQGVLREILRLGAEAQARNAKLVVLAD